MRSIWITCAISATVLWLCAAPAHAYDGYSACPKQYRSYRHHVQLPCNFHEQSWCTVPGSAYPWHAVRRFVHENHGLMRRMYGDERHISVLRAEIESNDVELVRDPGWHLEDDVKRRYSAKPHFRPANRNHQQPPPPPPPPSPEPQTTTTTTSTTTTTTSAPSTASTTSSTPPSSTTSTTTPTTTSAETSTASSTTTSPGVTTTEGAATSSQSTQAEPLGLYNGRVHPHLLNASLLASTSPRPAASSSLASSSTSSSPSTSPATTSTVADTTEDDWATEGTTVTTMSSSLPSPSTASTPSSSTASTSTERDEELADVEDNVADEPDGDVDGDADGDASGPSSAQETLFQDADHLPGPDAAQQPSKPATPLIKLRGVNACPVKEEVVAPFWANNTRGEVLALLNLYPFEQYVHWEKCTHEHKQMFCREGCRCEQQYRLHRLLAYDPNNECRGIFSDWFKFPSCCICRCYDLPAEFRFTSRSPRTPVLRAPSAPAAAPAYGSRRSRPHPAAAPAKDWYRLQASSGG